MSTITLIASDAERVQRDGQSPAFAAVPVTGFTARRVCAPDHAAPRSRPGTVRDASGSCITERPVMPATSSMPLGISGRPLATSAPAVKPHARRVSPVRSTARPVRLTRRGRLVVLTAFVATFVGLMVAFAGPVIATLSGGSGEPVRVVEVQPGQTLYDIAGRVARPGHVNEMVYRIEELNSLPDSDISAGQRLAVPRG